MSLTITEFTHLVIVRSSQQTANALTDHKLRESEHKTIEQQVEEFLKRGGVIDEIKPAKNVSTPAFVPNLTSPEYVFLQNALKNLKGMFGNELDIKPMPNGKFLAYYKGQQVGKNHPSISKAEAAIRCLALKDKPTITRRRKYER